MLRKTLAIGHWLGEQLGLLGSQSQTDLYKSEEKNTAVDNYHFIRDTFVEMLFPLVEQPREYITAEKVTIALKKYQLVYKENRWCFQEKPVKPSVQQAMLTAQALFRLIKEISVANVDYPYLRTRDLYWILKEHCKSFKPLAHDQELLELNTIQGQGREWFALVALEDKSKFTEKTVVDHTITLQRAFRKHLFVKNNNLIKKPIQSSEWLEKNLPEDYKNYPIELKPPVPTVNCAIDHKKAEKWVGAHIIDSRLLARKVIQATVYRSFKKFENNLAFGVRSFNISLASLPEENRNYILVLPFRRSKSNTWITNLALKFLAKPPAKILFLDEVKEFFADHKNNAIQHILLLDDASYSGKQIRDDVLSPLRYDIPESINIHVVIPFMTKIALARIEHLNNITIHRYERMLTIGELGHLGMFSRQEMDYLNKHQRGKYEATNRTLTYFDHSIADDYSTLHGILRWGNSIEGGFTHEQFIPAVIPPYKS